MNDRGCPSDSADFGSLLRRYRLAAGLSQDALAERARVSSNGISALERGRRRTPQRATLELLSGALALNAEQRRAFEEAGVRTSSPRRREGGSVTQGPWPSARLANLPLSLSLFVGRETELDEIAALLSEHRVVTLAGAGGIGKTQTALRAATAFEDVAECAVCFVGLAPISDPSLVTTSIATALGVQEVSNHPLLETLVAYLKSKSLLLILDNCEHLVHEAAVVVDALLLGCPRLRILATSREPLRAAGERTYRLPSLTMSDAGALFADRAQAADVHFKLTDENAPLVSELCRRLDGIPLAIELAAARANVLPLKTLASRLDDRFAVLTVGERTALPRQQTLREAIDWSYDLLSSPEKRVFERLSIFAGGCTLDAATTVCADDDVPASDVFALISSLVDKSLAVADLAGTGPRYRLLESFQEYARDKVRARSEEEVVASRHALACLELAKRLGQMRGELHYTLWYAHPRDELDNWRAAVGWALLARGNISLGQRLVGELVLYWGAYILADARRWIRAATNLVCQRTPKRLAARLWCAEAVIAKALDSHESMLESSERAVALYRAIGDEWGLMQAKYLMGDALDNLGRYPEAPVILKEALISARQLDARWHIEQILACLGCASASVGDFLAGAEYLAQACELDENADDQPTLARRGLNLAQLAYAEGNPQRALRHATQALAALRNLRLDSGDAAARAMSRRSVYLIALDRYDEAYESANEALMLASGKQLDALTAEALQHLATIAVLRDNNDAERLTDAYMRAARVIGFTEARFAAMGSGHEEEFIAVHDLALAVLRERLGADVVAILIAKGATMTEDKAIALALST